LKLDLRLQPVGQRRPSLSFLVNPAGVTNTRRLATTIVTARK
jgi:hypothetical protein